MAERGLFITFEGGDGAGKSTQIKLLALSLATLGHEVIVTFEPGDTPEGQAIRALFKSGSHYQWSPESQALLMFADRILHTQRVINPALELGKTILCDRFTDSTLAYQHYGAGLSKKLIEDLHTMIIGDLQPDLTIILDIDPKQALKRLVARENQQDDWFEKQDLGFHARLRQGFLQIARANPERCVVFDATLAPEILSQKITDLIKLRFSQ